MLLIPIQTPLLSFGDDLVKVLLEYAEFHSGDILAISSKVIASCEGSAMALQTIEPGNESIAWGKMHDRDPRFFQAVNAEALRMNGKIIDPNRKYLMTELHPDGFGNGSLLATNAGLDQSNCPEGYVVGWPHDPLQSMEQLHNAIKEKAHG